jgi:adenine-specific DNA-methyltransferase
MIKYIGSKRLLVDSILSALADLPQHAAVLDVFSGTSRVGQVLKRAGFEVSANDHNAYAATIARCYIEADRRLWLAPATTLIASLSKVPPKAGWFTKTYCEDSRFFHPDNGARVDAIRAHIDTLNLAEPLRSIALISLMEAADRVDSTTGVQMAYLKQWAARAHKPLTLRVPELLDGSGEATQKDATKAARDFSGQAAYLDPPYNQHSYRSNYHIWETLVRWDEPEVYGVACKRIDCRTEKSMFNSKPRIKQAFIDTIDALDVGRIVVSFNNEGYLPKEAIEEILCARGAVHTVALDYRRYVGAKIGIHNNKGKKVGKVSHTKNKELIFIVDGDSDRGAAAAAAVKASARS